MTSPPFLLGPRVAPFARCACAVAGILLIEFLEFGLFLGSAFAWTVPDHRLIAADAIAVLPEPLKQAFEAHQPRVFSGVIAPDFDPRRKADSHMLYLVAYRGSISGRGDAVFLLQEFAEQAEKLIRTGSDLGNALFVLAQGTHLVQDLNQPLHTVWGQTEQEHVAIEKRMTYSMWSSEYSYRGFQLIKKYGCFGYEIARRASENAMPLIMGSKDEVRRIGRLSWDNAVNDVANFWQSVFVKALGAEEAQRRYGIPRPTQEIGTGLLC